MPSEFREMLKQFNDVTTQVAKFPNASAEAVRKLFDQLQHSLKMLDEMNAKLTISPNEKAIIKKDVMDLTTQMRRSKEVSPQTITKMKELSADLDKALRSANDNNAALAIKKPAAVKTADQDMSPTAPRKR